MRCILTVLSMLTAGLTHAADVPLRNAWYQVEIVLFERPGADASGEIVAEHRPRHFPWGALAFDDGDARSAFYPLDADALAASQSPATFRNDAAAPPEETAPPTIAPPAAPPTPWQQLEAATEQFEEALGASSYRWQSADTLRLVAESRRIAAQPSLRVLHHGGWIQPVPLRDAPRPQLVQFGSRTGAQFEIEGTLTVTVGRYLHLAATLWLADSASADGGYFAIDETRRMRSGELHYFDHPRFGMLARIDPIELPASLRALAESIE